VSSNLPFPNDEERERSLTTRADPGDSREPGPSAPSQRSEIRLPSLQIDVKRTFWSTVTWPPREVFILLVVGPFLFFLVDAVQNGLVHGLFIAALLLPLFGFLWAFHHLLKAWAEWPSKRRWLSFIKAAVKYLLTDP
jgi:hypothetical protein